MNKGLFSHFGSSTKRTKSFFRILGLRLNGQRHFFCILSFRLNEQRHFFCILELRLNEKCLFRRKVGLCQMEHKSSPEYVIASRDSGPWALGTCSLRRIVPSRDTSTTESEIPSFRDAKPKQSVLAPRHCEERSDVAILSAGKDCFYTSSITPLR